MIFVRHIPRPSKSPLRAAAEVYLDGSSASPSKFPDSHPCDVPAHPAPPHALETDPLRQNSAATQPAIREPIPIGLNTAA